MKTICCLLLMCCFSATLCAQEGRTIRELKKLRNAIKGKTPDKNLPSEQSPATGTPEESTPKPAVDSLTPYRHFDFVRGTKPVYAEDFAQHPLGELPEGWNSNAGGALVKFPGDESKWLELQAGTYLSGADVKAFGEHNTIEFDMILNVESKMGYYLPSFTIGLLASGTESPGSNKFLNNTREFQSVELEVSPSQTLSSKLHLRSFENKKEIFNGQRIDNSTIGGLLKKKIHFSFDISKTRLRVWVNELKVIDVPRAIGTSHPINQVYFRTENSGGYPTGSYSYMVSNIMIAQGKSQPAHSLQSTGSFTTSAILFDVNKATILPHSMGAVREIAELLKQNPEWKIKITGHTDSDGNKAANLTLSRARSTAVKNTLIKEFGISEETLVSDGKGADEPLVPNANAANKALNRRVVFTKL